MNKRGMELMLKNIIEIIIAVLVILLVIYAGIVLFKTYFGNQEEMQAKGALDSIVITLAKTNETGMSNKLLLENPAGWRIVAFNASNNKNGDFDKPSGFFGKNTVCICKKFRLFEKACRQDICRQVSMPLMQTGNQASIEIEIKEVYFMNMKDYFETSEKPIEKKELTEDEKTKFGITKVEIENKYGDAITGSAEKYYPEVKNYFDDASDFRKFIEAIVYIESSGNPDAKSLCGAAGLMQLMPDTAREQGLKVPDYRQICGGGECPDPYSKCYYAFECNKIAPEKCQADDERFDAVKNADGGTKYVAKLINRFNDVQLALAAYNAGPGNVEKYCKPLINIKSCSDFSGREYSSDVMSHYLA
jgi:hypothetical protein